MKKALTHNSARRRPALTFRVRVIGTLTLFGLVAGLGLLASRPAHTAGGPIAVAVSNTVQNRDADNPDRQPFMQYVSIVTTNGDNTIAMIPIPAGKRLVIETVTAYRSAVSDPTVNAQIYIQTQIGRTNGLFAMPLLTDKLRIATEPIHIRADPGTDVLIVASISGPVSSEEDDVTVSGYLVDMP